MLSHLNNAVLWLGAMLLCGLILPGTSTRAQSLTVAKSTPGIPFDFFHHEVVVQVRVNGQGPFAMFLDTGTDPSVIDLNVARQVGLKLASVGQAGEGGGTAKNLAYETSLSHVGMGSFAASNVPAVAMDLSALSRRFGRPIQGILGDSLFTERIVQFDYPGRTARFFSRSPFAGQGRRLNTARYVTLPFRHQEEVHLSGVRVNGHPVRANLDTGSNTTFSLTPQAVRRLGLGRVAAQAKAESGAGFNGGFVSRTGKIQRIQVGTVTVSTPSVTFWLPNTGHDASPWDINIGNAFLQDFVVTIDYRADTVTLQRP